MRAARAPRSTRSERTHPSYAAVHLRLPRERERAVEHRCVDCSGPAAHWSYRGGAAVEYAELLPGGRTPTVYTPELRHYEPRCFRCHAAADTAARFGRCKRDDACRWLAGNGREHGPTVETTDIFAAAEARRSGDMR